MHPPPPAQGLPPKAAIEAAGKRWRKKMRVLTINELMRLTRIELCDLAQRIIGELPTFAEGSAEQFNVLTTLRNIRFVLARREFSPRGAKSAFSRSGQMLLRRRRERTQKDGHQAHG